MRVVHLSCVAPPEIGGIGRVASIEVDSLCARGIDAMLISSTSCRSFWRYGNAAALDLRSVMEELRNADIVHLHYPFYGTAGMIANLRRRKIIRRLVITLHMDATATGFKKLYFNIHRKFLQPYILRTADAMCISSLDYARHSSFAPFADRLIELPFGVDEKKFSPSQDARPTDAATLLFVGGMDRAHAFKGVEVLLRALARMRQNVTLFLVGDGDLRPSYETLARELGVSDRVTFCGRVSEDELPHLYRRALILVLPSVSGAEAFGLAALEAQACGVPVVASDLPGVRTVVAHGETGFLVPPCDAHALAERLTYLCEHADVRRVMGRRARERVLERFTWSRHIERLIQQYGELM